MAASVTLLSLLVTWLSSLVFILPLRLGKPKTKPILAKFRYPKQPHTSSGKENHDEGSSAPGKRAVDYAEHFCGSSRPYPFSAWGKLYEYSRWVCSEIWVRWQNGCRPLDYISSRARFSCYVFEPYYHWFGMNQRVVLTSGLNQVVLRNKLGGHDTCVSEWIYTMSCL